VNDPSENENIAKNENKLLEFKTYGNKKAEEFKERRPNSKEKITYEDEEEVEDRLEALGYR